LIVGIAGGECYPAVFNPVEKNISRLQDAYFSQSVTAAGLQE